MGCRLAPRQRGFASRAAGEGTGGTAVPIPLATKNRAPKRIDTPCADQFR
jgi:hypothetical protein